MEQKILKMKSKIVFILLNLFFLNSCVKNDFADNNVINKDYPIGFYDAEYNQFIIYGQSLSIGGNFNYPIDFPDCYTFSGGILTNYNPTNVREQEVYYGYDFIPLQKNGIETQGKGLVKILKELIRYENGLSYNDQNFSCIVNAPGACGMPYCYLSDKNDIYYRRLIESVVKAKEFATEKGKSFCVPVLCYIQGESTNDMNDIESVFYSKLEKLFDNLNTDIKAITGQVNDVQFINYQIASFSPCDGGTSGRALAQLQISKDKINVHFGCAMYQLSYLDLYHVDNVSTRLMGAMMGVVAKRAIIDRQKMNPISPLSCTIEKKESLWLIKMKMNVPVKPLVFDETVNFRYKVKPMNKGFSILNSNLSEIISSITLTDGETLNIFCTEDPAGKELTYAIGGHYSGGNLRDSQGDNIKINCETIKIRVDNWCPIFRYLIQ